MNKDAVKARIQEIGIIPAVRLSSHEDALFAIEAVATAGIPIAEVTLTVPGAIEIIAEVSRRHPQIIAGAGTVMDAASAQRAIDAGAKFITSTGLDLPMVEFAVKQDVVVFPGAFTPSEVMAAWKAGSDFVKIFPCSAAGGPSYIRALKSPFPEIPMIASGGVNQQTAGDFIRAGATALGIGRGLVAAEAVHRRDQRWIHELTHRFSQIVQQAREQKSQRINS